MLARLTLCLSLARSVSALGGELADGSSAQPTSPSSDPSALKRRRLTRSDSADKTPSVSPMKAALATLEQVGEEPSGEQEQEQQDDPTDADLALLTALAQEHAAELDGILGEQEADGETSLPAPDAADVEDADDTRRLGPADAARLLKIYEACVPPPLLRLLSRREARLAARRCARS